MMKRPLLGFTCFFTAGILYSMYFNWGLMLIVMSVSFVLLLVFTRYRDKLYLILGLSLAVFICGAAYAHHRSYHLCKPFEPYSQNDVSFVAQVISQHDLTEKKVSYLVNVKNISHNLKTVKINSRVLLSIYSPKPEQTNFKYGDIINGNARVMLPSPARNFGAFDYRRYLTSQKICCSFSAAPNDINYSGKAKLNHFIAFSLYLKDRIINIIDLSLPSEHAGLLKGIVIGERSGIPENIEDNFNISGLTHILCVSGANIAYVAGASLFLLGILRIKSPYSNIITIIILVLFTYITGSSPSVVRAAIMGIILLLAGVFSRKSDVLTSISAACLVILAYNPMAIYDVGFQLSFAGTIGIVLFYKNLVTYLQFLPGILKEVMSVTLAAQLTVNPLIALYFNKISLIALVSNLVVVPLTGVVTILGFIMSVIGQAAVFLAQLIAGLNYFFLSFMLRTSELMANIPFATVQVITPSLTFVILYYVLLYTLLWYIPVKKPGPKFFRILYASILSVVLVSAVMFFLPKPLEITFLDIGQGDCSFIKTPSGRTCLVDGGGTYPGSMSSFDPGSTVIPFLLDNGVTSIDLAILTHAHGDHIQGLIQVVQSFNVKELVIGPQFESNSDLTTLLNICKAKNVQIVQVSRGSIIHMEDVKLEVIHPPVFNQYSESSCLNNNSLVFRLDYKNFSALFTGDIQVEAENDILSSGLNVDTDVLKIPHHGSPGSTTSSFLKAVSPSVCIISVGRNNFGHPSQKVIDRIQDIKSQKYRTDLNGGINIRTHGNQFKVAPCISD